MTNIQNIIYLILVLLSITACEVNIVDDSIVFNDDIFGELPDTVVIGEEETILSLGFVAGGKWQASIDERTSDWCILHTEQGDKGGNVISISVTSNEEFFERNAALTVICGASKRILTIIQKQKSAILLESSRIEVPEKGGDYSIPVKASYDIEACVADCDWIHLNASETKSITNHSLRFSVDQNTDLTQREGKIHIKSGKLSETVTVYQAKGKEVMILTQSEYLVPSEGDVICVEVKSNTDYEFSIDASWINEVKTKAISSYTHYFSIEENESYDGRSAFVVFKNIGTSQADTIKITQQQKKAILIETDSIYAPAGGGEYVISYKSNVDIEAMVFDECDWLHLESIATKALTSKDLLVFVDRNFELENRSARILLKADGLSDTVRVVQSIGEAALVLTKSNYVVPCEGEIIEVEIQTNINYEYTIDCEWVSEVTTKAVMYCKHLFLIEPNTSLDSRTATVTFTNKDSGKQDKVTILQLQTDNITIDKEEYVVSSKEQTLAIPVTANAEISISIQDNPDWITLSDAIQTKGMVSSQICFSIAENDHFDDRFAIVSIKAGNANADIVIKQLATNNFLDVLLTHSETSMPPLTVGGVYGIIEWGDGLVDEGQYNYISTHDFKDDSEKTTRFLFRDVGGFVLQKVGTVSKIIIIAGEDDE